MEYNTNDVIQTEKLGAELAESLPCAPAFVALYGDLGAGKTAFVRGFTSVLSPGSRVKSPTYTIVNEYRKGKCPVYHFDLYRIESEDDLDAIGFEEYVQNGICIAEWCEHIGDLLPEHAVTVKIEKTGENERKITISKEGE